jgi:hypothetical protein
MRRAIAIRWMTALVEPPIAASVLMARQDLRQHQVLVHHVNDAAARIARDHVAPAVDSGIGGVARQSKSESFDHARHRGGGAHGHAVPVAAVHAALGFEKVLKLQRAGPHLLAHAPHAGARAEFLPAPLAIEHRAAGNADGRQVNARGAHHQRRRGLVASHEQHDTIDRIAADAFLHVHAGEVAIQHGSGPQQRLAERHDREFEGESAGFVDADLDLLGERAEMRIARRELAERIADADYRTAVELVVRHALAFDPAAIGKAIAVLASEPLLAPQFGRFLFGHGLLGSGAWLVRYDYVFWLD